MDSAQLRTRELNLHPERIFKEFLRLLFNFFVRWYLQFIRSEFRGQLPKPYSEGSNATKIIPTHMNDMNKEETTRYVSIVYTKFILCFLFLLRENNIESLFLWLANKIFRPHFSFKPFMKGSAQNQQQRLKSFRFCHVFASHTKRPSLSTAMFLLCCLIVLLYTVEPRYFELLWESKNSL